MTLGRVTCHGGKQGKQKVRKKPVKNRGGAPWHPRCNLGKLINPPDKGGVTAQKRRRGEEEGEGKKKQTFASQKTEKS